MNPIKIGLGGEFSLGGEKFVIEVAVPPKDRRPSVHDIFLPFDYWKDRVIDELRLWTEQYLLQSFLSF